MRISLDDDKFKGGSGGGGGGDIDWYRGVKGRTDRIGLYTDQPFMMYNHYGEVNGKGGYWKCLSEVDEHGNLAKRAICCEKMGDAAPRFGVPIIHYHTQQNGDLKSPFGYDIKVWLFSATKLNQLKVLRKNWGALTDKDLMISCIEDTRQNLNINVLPEAVWKKKEEIEADVRSKAEEVMEVIPRLIGKTASEEDWNRHFGLLTTSAEDVSLGSSVDIDDLLNDD
jgi:hypothetical protein